ncbi:hypothetical protein K0M31_014795 [Melipona bicolor]|uniref:Uncharacterized protein n=1 Tax=Melipona bicolor TaxID=60889 RepID=A0AA40KFZ4_9HYME|nr:hypothetical protein K0M31_014795 [Melipona bicolor]
MCPSSSFSAIPSGVTGAERKWPIPVDPSCPLTRRPLMHRPDWRQPPRCFDTRRRVTPANRRGAIEKTSSYFIEDTGKERGGGKTIPETDEVPPSQQEDVWLEPETRGQRV